MEQKDLLKVKNAIDKATEDTTPIVGIVEDEVVVNGDVNNIDIEPKTYRARFVFPDFALKDIEGAVPASPGYSTVTIEYKDVFPSAKDNIKYTSAMTQLLPFYNELKEDGTIEAIDDVDTLINIFQNLEDEIVDALYRIVKVVLGIDDSLIEHLAPIGEGSALELAVRIIEDFPSIVNQADLFFDSSTKKA